MDYNTEQLIRNTLSEHGFSESKAKPGLFFKEYGKGKMIYADCRRNGDAFFYGYLDKETPMPEQVLEEHIKRVKQAMAAIGCAKLDEFSGDSHGPSAEFLRGKPTEEDLIELLAAIEHDQWIHWSKKIAHDEAVSLERIDRWNKFWVPYQDLDEATKEFDREWARKVLKALTEVGAL